MHLLGTSVLTLILLPLAVSCGQEKKITDNYRNIIGPQLRHVVDGFEKLNKNCSRRPVNASMGNAQKDIPTKICKCAQKLMGIEIPNEQLKEAFNILVNLINVSMECRSQKKERPIRKRKLCKVKNMLANLQTHFEQYNAYQ